MLMKNLLDAELIETNISSIENQKLINEDPVPNKNFSARLGEHTQLPHYGLE